jgi:hypothetical protein
MADASRTSFSGLPATPQSWGEAFAALPAEAPDASRWPMLAQAAARRAARTRRRRMGLALAAGLCALALLPFALHRADEHAVAPAPTAYVASTSTATRPDAAQTTPATSIVAAPTDPMPTDPTPKDTATTHAVAPTPRFARLDHPKPRTTARRSAGSSHAAAPVVADATPTAPDTDTRSSLDTLYATSAQLESLLALARDTRVDSGPAAALAGDYDAELAAIDAHLAQPALPASEQVRLWQARVDTLQQAAGLESQLRTLAASGGRLDGALVTID